YPLALHDALPIYERTVQWGEKLLIFDEAWLVFLANPPPHRRNVAPLHTTQYGRVRQLQSIQRIGKALGQSSPFVCRRRLHLRTLGTCVRVLRVQSHIASSVSD